MKRFTILVMFAMFGLLTTGFAGVTKDTGPPETVKTFAKETTASYLAPSLEMITAPEAITVETGEMIQIQKPEALAENSNEPNGLDLYRWRPWPPNASPITNSKGPHSTNPQKLE
jgi:hypothetical protein